MKIANYEEIKLNAEMFREVRDSFDVLLQKLFKKMEDNNSDERSIDLKLNIGIKKTSIPDGENKTKEVNMPIIKHKIQYTVPVKDGLDGTKDTGMALVYDEELKRYVLKYVDVDGQMSIWDDEVQAGFNNNNDVVDVIEAKDVKQIEDKSAESGDSGEDADSDDESIGESQKNVSRGDTEATDDDVDDDYGYDDPEEW